MEPMVPTAAAFARRAASLGRLRDGSPVDLVSPLISKGAPDKDAARAELWEDFRRHLKLMTVLPRDLRQREEEEIGKMGPMSIQLPYSVSTMSVPSLRKQVLRYFTPKKVRIDIRAAKVADRAVKAKFQISMSESGKLRPMSLLNAANSFLGAKNMGHPVYSSRRDEFFNAIYEESLALQQELPSEMLDQYPAMLVTRLDSAGPYEASKARTAFGCSRVVGNLAQVFRVPLYEALSHDDTFCAWGGRTAVRVQMTKLMEKFGRYRDIISLDYSGFDASVPMEIMYRIFSIWMDVFPKASRRELEWLRDEFLQESLWTPDGLQTGRHGGLPSGSPFTNVMGSCVNVWAAVYAATRAHTTIDSLLVNGDDGVLVLHDQSDPIPVGIGGRTGSMATIVAQILKEELGLTISVEKGSVSPTDAVFLQDSYMYGHYANDGLLRAMRPAARVFRKALGYERYRSGWNAACDSLRWLQQWEAMQDHYCFPAACDWLLQHDKVLRSVSSVDSLIEQAGGLTHASEVLNELNGHKVTVNGLKWSAVARQLGLTSRKSLTDV